MTPEHYGTVNKIWITGGTIEAHAIGGKLPENVKNNICIDGGSVLAMAMSSMPLNSKRYALVPIQFKQTGASSPADLQIHGFLTIDGVDYGTNELYPDEYGDLYLWVMTGNYRVKIDGEQHDMYVRGRWIYSLDNEAQDIQVGENAWALVQNGLCYIYGQGAMWDAKDDEQSVLWDCRNSITNLVVDGGVTTLGKRTFECMDALKKVTFDATNVVTICDKALYMCPSLTSVHIVSEVQRIGASAFKECEALELVKADAAVSDIDPTAIKLTAYIRMEGDEPIITGLPVLDIPGYETLSFGKRELTGDETWTAVTDENLPEFRFFQLVFRPQE